MKPQSNEHRAYTPEEIGEWILRYRASGLGLGCFAAQHGLAKSRLHYWVYDKRYSKLAKPLAAVPLFQEVKLAGGLAMANWVAEVSLAAGVTVRFSAAATGDLIRSVVEALQRPC
ncbi:MAG: IS66 family insertion sequence element accessory protein TnpA [Limisphaerales bacterium]